MLSETELLDLRRLAKKAGIGKLTIPKQRQPYKLSRKDMRNIQEQLALHNVCLCKLTAGHLRVWTLNGYLKMQQVGLRAPRRQAQPTQVGGLVNGQR